MRRSQVASTILFSHCSPPLPTMRTPVWPAYRQCVSSLPVSLRAYLRTPHARYLSHYLMASAVSSSCQHQTLPAPRLIKTSSSPKISSPPFLESFSPMKRSSPRCPSASLAMATSPCRRKMPSISPEKWKKFLPLEKPATPSGSSCPPRDLADLNHSFVRSPELAPQKFTR